MSSFRKYGGANRSAIGNIVRHDYANETKVTISNSVGLDNSKILSQSHLDMSCNSLLNVQNIYFCEILAFPERIISEKIVDSKLRKILQSTIKR